MYKRITGTKDILPQEAPHWQKIEAVSREVFSLYNYQEIRTPLLEGAALFNRSLGEGAEIVQKQMFLIQRDKETYALRPEGTAAIVRAYIENNLDKASGLSKLFYIGAMFRAERPQKGRLRQFHHIGCEAIGSNDPLLDVEVISLAENILRSLSIGGYEIKVNSLGCEKDKKALTEVLRKGLKGEFKNLCPDCQRRFEGNILRILDCKNEECRKVVSGLDVHSNNLCPECNERFATVKDGLSALGVKYALAPLLVRGLDYYTSTVFEITHPQLGAQDAIGAGGRYDHLLKELGGPELGAIGFAFGVERLMLVHSPEPIVHSNKLVYIIPLGEEARKQGIKLLAELRCAGIAVDTDYENKSLKGAMRRANDLAAKVVLIIGEDELKKDTVMLKDMGTGEQREIKQDNLIGTLKTVFSV